MVATDPDREELVPMIETEYSDDSLALEQFRGALASESALRAEKAK